MALSKETLERLIARSTDIIVATDRHGMVIYYNDGASRSLGYAPDEVLDRFVGQLYPDLLEAKRVMTAMRDPARWGKGNIETFKTTFLAKTGERIPVAISGTIIYDDLGEEDGTIGFAKDLRDLLRKDKLATLGEVAVGLSHEINNPLAVILNQIELLERDIDSLAGERDCSVEAERMFAMRREVSRVSEILERLAQIAGSERVETVEYVGPTRMIDLRRRSPARERDPRLVGVRVLVVDDDAGICRSLAEILEAEGCVVTTASNGADALARVESDHFDVVLTDVVMPKMDGHELFCEIRERFPGLPVLMMTAFHHDKDHIIKRSKLRGLEGVIFKKPVDPGRLRQVLIDTVTASRHTR